MLAEKTKDRWRTPEPILAFAREAMGRPFDIDPATDSDNPTNAHWFFTRPEDALRVAWQSHPWFVDSTRLWLNPPFSKLKAFADRLAAWLATPEVCLDSPRQACFVGSYSLEAEWAAILSGASSFDRYQQRDIRPLIFCPSPRIRFKLPPEAPPDTKQPGGYPAQVWVWSCFDVTTLAKMWLAHVGGRVTVFKPAIPETLCPFPST